MEILGATLAEMTAWLKKTSGKGVYHGEALFREVCKHGNPNFYDAQEFRASPKLVQAVAPELTLTPGEVIHRARDGALTKFVTQLGDGKKIESVIIPMRNRHTLCVSSQVGCKMGCAFCETGKMGFHRNLEPHEILGQLYNANFVLKKRIKNVVFMGMGEPLDNFDSVIKAIQIMNLQKGFDIALRHITLSTAGLAPAIDRLAKLGLSGLRLAVSVNAADNATRSRIMPVNTTYSLDRLKRSLVEFPLSRRGTFLFEYILIKGLNDSKKDAISLAEYINPLSVRLNLIPYNPVDGFNYLSPDDDEMNGFAAALEARGVFVIKRWSKGRSVSAGCGQLGGQC